jgi:4a-hydroxytetrahydrobiopterin dehydratase
VSRPEVIDHGTVDAALEGSPWRREGDELVLEQRFASFPAALGFVTSVGALAEARDHHPDFELRYRDVRLVLSTHEVGALTARDLALAKEVSELLG